MYIYICLCVYIYTYTYIFIYIYIHIYIYTPDALACVVVFEVVCVLVLRSGLSSTFLTLTQCLPHTETDSAFLNSQKQWLPPSHRDSVPVPSSQRDSQCQCLAHKHRASACLAQRFTLPESLTTRERETHTPRETHILETHILAISYISRDCTLERLQSYRPTLRATRIIETHTPRETHILETHISRDCTLERLQF